MKKSKIILAAITILTIAGGTLAFKANRGSTIYTSNAAGAMCIHALPNWTISTSGFPAFAHPVMGQPCVQTSIKEKQ